MERFAAEPGATADSWVKQGHVGFVPHLFLAHAMNCGRKQAIPINAAEAPSPRSKRLPRRREHLELISFCEASRTRIAEARISDLRKKKKPYLHLVQTGNIQLDRYGFVRWRRTACDSFNTLTIKNHQLDSLVPLHKVSVRWTEARVMESRDNKCRFSPRFPVMENAARRGCTEVLT